MNIFFDMDYTLIGLTGTLRPLVKETFQQLLDDGHTLYIWSGIGERRREVRNLGLEPYVSGVHHKPIDDYEAIVQAKFERQELEVYPDLVIDDHTEIVSALGGVVVRAFFAGDQHDREMERVYRVIRDYVESGASTDPAFRPRPDNLYGNGDGGPTAQPL